MKMDNKIGRDYTFVEVDKEGLYFKGWDGTPSEDNLVVTTDMRQAKMFRVIDGRNDDVGARKEIKTIRSLGHEAKFCILDFVPRVKDRWTKNRGMFISKTYEIDKVLPMVKELIEDGYCPKTDNAELDIDCSAGGQCCKDCWYDRLIQVIESGGEC